MLRCEVLCDGDFPLIAIRKKLLLVINQLFVSFGCELVVRAFNDCIDFDKAL
jgi:hypothetical protein